MKQRKDCISRKNRAVTRQKSSEYLLYSEDFQRSKRRFLLGKTTFLIFQAAPGLPTYRTPRNGSLFRGADYRKRQRRKRSVRGKSLKKGWRTPFSFKITPRRARRTGPQALFVGSLAQKRSFCAKLKRVECSARFFRACQEKRFLTRSQKEVSGVLSCGAASESSVSEEDVVSSSGRPAVFITNFTLARTPSALPV